MNVIEQSRIETLHPEKKRGYVITADVYDKIRAFIISSLQEYEEVLLKELIDLAHRSILAPIDNLAWYLVIVKLDLEARGIITCSIAVGLERNQILRIKRKRKKRGTHG